MYCIESSKAGRPEQSAAAFGASARLARRFRAVAIACCIVTVAACDLSVTNPGPVDDRFLDDAAAHLAMVNGASRALSYAVNRVNFYGLVVAREMIASGGSANRGHSVFVERGELNYEEGNVEAKWAAAQRARWIAEESVRRIRAAGEATFNTSPLAARALVYTGFSNRLLGENMCFAVIDEGPAEPFTVHFTRAEEAFTNAITVATAANLPEFAMAARAGRAVVRAHLKKWPEARADAAAVPTAFRFDAPNYTTSQDENNKIVDANLSQPWRSLSVYNTWFENYYTTTGDPRTPWSFNPATPMGDGRPVPWRFETKYKRNRAAPIKLTSGREMRLLEAEADLREGKWQDAATKINALRSSVISELNARPLSPWPTTSLVETWTALKLERAIELWLEARLLGYHREWQMDSTPGPLPAQFDMTGRSMCFPISKSEELSNPNIP
jgi:hypothetical protein